MRDRRFDINAQTIGIALFGVFALVVAVYGLVRIFDTDQAVAAAIEAQSSRSRTTDDPGQEVRITVPSGALPGDIVRMLTQQGVVSDPESLRTLLAFSGVGDQLLAGEYRFTTGTPSTEVIRRLRGGPDQIERITFRVGLRTQEIGEILEREGFFPEAEWTAAIEATPPRDFMDGETDFTGYLMPGTYEVEEGVTTAESLLAEMLDRFEEEVPADLIAEAEAQGWTLYEVVTLASIVEKEAVHPEEKPAVAAVFRNRLDEGMALQADPTVQFALTLGEFGDDNVLEFGWWKAGLTVDDLAIDSPYNTYLYPGLIPGPIANVDGDSIRAVIRPAAVAYVYFVAHPDCDGHHLFASSLDEHNANVEIFRESGCGEEDE